MVKVENQAAHGALPDFFGGITQYPLAPPIYALKPWQFVENNDFTDKKVILFNTFNSRFKQEYIDAFKEKVEANNGQFVKHLYVKRGRMTRQISPENMLRQVRTQLDSLPGNAVSAGTAALSHHE